MNTGFPDDDRIAAKKVIKALPKNIRTERVDLMEIQYGPREMKGIFGLMDLVVGVRFHSLVLSSSMGTPVLSIGYAPKNRAIMSLIEQDKYFVKLNEVSRPWLIEQAFQILKNRKSVVGNLRQVYKHLNSIYDDEINRISTLIIDWKR
jgi:polysaccharide pyruvyl transferase WcaK-like protein